MTVVANKTGKNIVAIGYGSRLCGDDGVGQEVAVLSRAICQFFIALAREYCEYTK